MSVGTQLAKAAEALKAGDPEKAAAQLAAAWRDGPALELLEAACALSPPPPLLGKNGKATIAALEAACREKPDPRTSRALETLFRDLPFTADSSKPVWRAACQLAAHLGDPRFVELARTLPPTWKAREAITSWLASQLNKAVAPLAHAKPPVLDAPARKALAALSASAPAKKPKAGSDDVNALRAAVYASPDDDDARRVLADALLEQGDERGEFILLQLKAAPTPADEKRSKQLLKAHGDAWVDGLERFMTKQRTFTRGFVSEAKMLFKTARDAETAASLPAWSTLETFTFGEGTSSGSHEWGQTIPSALRGVRALNGLRTRGVQNVLAVKAPWPKLEAIEGSLGDFQTWQALTTSPLLPALRTVDLSGVELGWLRRAPPPASWAHLTLHGGDAPGAALAVAHGLKNERISIRTREGRWHFTRDSKGRLTQLLVELLFAHRASMAALELKQLPGGSLTKLDAEAPELKALGATLLGAGEVNAAPAAARALGRPFAIGFSGDEALWADQEGVVDEAMKERVTSRWSDAAFSGDGRTVVGRAGGQLERFDLQTGARTAQITSAWVSHGCLCVSRDARVIASARPAETLVHREGEEQPLSLKGSSVVALSPDGTRLAREVSKGPVTRVELDVLGTKGKPVRIEGLTRSVAALAFSPDGTQLAISTRDDTLWLAPVDGGAPRALAGVKSGHLAWAPDGARLAVASLDGSVVVALSTGKTTRAPAALAVAWSASGQVRFASDAPHRLVTP